MDELRQGNRGEETAKGRRLREWLVAGQVALALVLVTQVGLVGRATWRLHNLSTGFDPAQVLTFRMNLRESDYPDKEIRHSFYMRALERIAALPGVSAAGTTSQLPFADREMTIRFVIQGQPAPEPGFHPEAARSTVSYSYLATLGIPLVRGRTLSRADVDDAAPVALISQEAARRYWPGDDPIGKRFAFEDEGDTWLEIVGVVGNVRSASGFGPVPQVYVPASRGLSNAIAFLVRTAGANPTSIAASVRSEMAALDRMQPVYDVRAMRRVISQNLGGTYLFTGMLAVFAVIALLLAAAGAYGLVSFSVTQRTREIGVRMALGARPAAILRMIVGRSSVPTAIGIAIGAAGAAAAVSVTASALSEVDVRDPIAYLLVITPLVALVFLGTCIPARRATKVDPMLALRAE
jgi:putative ABC transport system permease protein